MKKVLSVVVMIVFAMALLITQSESAMEALINFDFAVACDGCMKAISDFDFAVACDGCMKTIESNFANLS